MTSSTMIDTQVLSYGLSSELARSSSDQRQQRDSAALIAELDEVRVSAIVVLEMLRASPSVVAKFKASGIMELLHVEPIDDRVASEAARILEAARGGADTCPRCLNLKAATPCKACGQLVSHQQKTHDAIIIATASVLPEVTKLYSYDAGIAELSKFAKNVRVVSPPNVDGPLFARA